MREVFVYHSRANYEAADAFVASLRARGDITLVRQCRSDRWEGDVLGDAVYHDGSSRALVWAHQEAGIRVELFGESATQVEREPDPIEVDSGESDDDLPDGYHIEHSGSWHSVIGPDGEKVGKSHRTEDAAIEAARTDADA